VEKIFQRASGVCEIWQSAATESRIFPSEIFMFMKWEETGVAACSLFVEAHK
jgi:hypothetical protein